MKKLTYQYSQTTARIENFKLTGLASSKQSNSRNQANNFQQTTKSLKSIPSISNGNDDGLTSHHSQTKSRQKQRNETNGSHTSRKCPSSEQQFMKSYMNTVLAAKHITHGSFNSRNPFEGKPWQALNTVQINLLPDDDDEERIEMTFLPPEKPRKRSAGGSLMTGGLQYGCQANHSNSQNYNTNIRSQRSSYTEDKLTQRSSVTEKLSTAAKYMEEGTRGSRVTSRLGGKDRRSNQSGNASNRTGKDDSQFEKHKIWCQSQIERDQQVAQIQQVEQNEALAESNPLHLMTFVERPQEIKAELIDSTPLVHVFSDKRSSQNRDSHLPQKQSANGIQIQSRALAKVILEPNGDCDLDPSSQSMQKSSIVLVSNCQKGPQRYKKHQKQKSGPKNTPTVQINSKDIPTVLVDETRITAKFTNQSITDAESMEIDKQSVPDTKVIDLLANIDYSSEQTKIPTRELNSNERINSLNYGDLGVNDMARKLPMNKQVIDQKHKNENQKIEADTLVIPSKQMPILSSNSSNLVEEKPQGAKEIDNNISQNALTDNEIHSEGIQPTIQISDFNLRDTNTQHLESNMISLPEFCDEVQDLRRFELSQEEEQEFLNTSWEKAQSDIEARQKQLQSQNNIIDNQRKLSQEFKQSMNPGHINIQVEQFSIQHISQNEQQMPQFIDNSYKNVNFFAIYYQIQTIRQIRDLLEIRSGTQSMSAINNNNDLTFGKHAIQGLSFDERQRIKQLCQEWWDSSNEDNSYFRAGVIYQYEKKQDKGTAENQMKTDFQSFVSLVEGTGTDKQNDCNLCIRRCAILQSIIVGMTAFYSMLMRGQQPDESIDIDLDMRQLLHSLIKMLYDETMLSVSFALGKLASFNNVTKVSESYEYKLHQQYCEFIHLLHINKKIESETDYLVYNTRNQRNDRPQSSYVTNSINRDCQLNKLSKRLIEKICKIIDFEINIQTFKRKKGNVNLLQIFKTVANTTNSADFQEAKNTIYEGISTSDVMPQPSEIQPDKNSCYSDPHTSDINQGSSENLKQSNTTYGLHLIKTFKDDVNQIIQEESREDSMSVSNINSSRVPEDYNSNSQQDTRSKYNSHSRRKMDSSSQRGYCLFQTTPDKQSNNNQDKLFIL